MSEITLVRAWNWGIAILLDVDHGDIPDVDTDSLVTVGDGAIIILVQHSQDSTTYTQDGRLVPATATVHVRVREVHEQPSRLVACDVVLDTPGNKLSLGDAEDEIVLNGCGRRTRVVVSVDDPDPGHLSPDEVWIDLAPATGADAS